MFAPLTRNAAEDVEDLSVEVGEGVLGKEQGEERRGTALSVDCVTTFSSPLLREIRSRGISLARSLARGGGVSARVVSTERRGERKRAIGIWL